MEEITCKDIEGNLKTIKTADLVFQPSVYGLLLQDGKILLSRQWDGYDYPGGRMEKGESVEECLRREFFEETGLQIEVGKILHAQVDFFIRPYSNEAQQTLLLFYTCTLIGGELSVSNFDENEKKYAALAEWIDLDNIAKIKFYNPVDNQKIIDNAK